MNGNVCVSEDVNAERWKERIQLDEYRGIAGDFVDSIMPLVEKFGIPQKEFYANMAFLQLVESNTLNLINILAQNKLVPPDVVNSMGNCFLEASARFTGSIADLIVSICESYNECVADYNALGDRTVKQDATIQSLMDALIATGKEVPNETHES